MSENEPQYCGGIHWRSAWEDPWRCRGVMTEYHDGIEGLTHLCAASDDHEGEHCCALGHRWKRSKPRLTWRQRLRHWLDWQCVKSL